MLEVRWYLKFGGDPGRPGCHLYPSEGTMRAYRMLLPALALAISVPAAAQNEVPAALQSLKPHQIVQAVAAERQTLDLTAVQERRLDSLDQAIRSEPHRYAAAPSPGKAHQDARMQPMMSDQQAYADALAILTPEQRTRARARFSDADYRLPPELKPARAGAGQAGEPLHQHAPGAAPDQQSTKPAETAKDPLQHRGGEAPRAVDADTSKPANPVTHQR